MKRFYKNLFLFSFPLVVVLLIVLYIDPYYLYHKNRKYNQIKYDIGYSFDQGHRYKIFTFLNSPSSNIILGASEINVIHERNIPEDGWHSLSFGGARLEESIDLFWKIVDEYEIKHLLFAPEFIKFYNACLGEFYLWNSSQSAKAYSMYKDKLEYLIDKEVIQSTYYYILYNYGIESKRGKPKTTKNEFWKHQLEYGKEQYLKKVVSGNMDYIYSRLQEMGDYCKTHNIRTTIVLPIQHVDLISLEYADEIYPIYRNYLSKLVDIFGEVYNFDYPCINSSDSTNFSDPFHYTNADIYIESLWGDERKNYLLLNSRESLMKVDSLKKNYVDMLK